MPVYEKKTDANGTPRARQNRRAPQAPILPKAQPRPQRPPRADQPQKGRLPVKPLRHLLRALPRPRAGLPFSLKAQSATPMSGVQNFHGVEVPDFPSPHPSLPLRRHHKILRPHGNPPKPSLIRNQTPKRHPVGEKVDVSALRNAETGFSKQRTAFGTTQQNGIRIKGASAHDEPSQGIVGIVFENAQLRPRLCNSPAFLEKFYPMPRRHVVHHHAKQYDVEGVILKRYRSSVKDGKGGLWDVERLGLFDTGRRNVYTEDIGRLTDFRFSQSRTTRRNERVH
jgi:hypothetical protein